MISGCRSNSDIKVKGKKKDSNTSVSVPSEYNDNGIFKDYYEAAYNKLMSMNIDEKIGQMLLVRMDDTKVDSIINDYHVAGFVMFSRDFKNKSKEEVKSEIDKYQGMSKIPLLFLNESILNSFTLLTINLLNSSSIFAIWFCCSSFNESIIV